MQNSTMTGVARNTSIMFVQQLVTWVSSFVLLILLPRYLGPVEYGRLFLAVSIVDMFRVLVTYGGNYLIAKNVSRDRQSTGQVVVDAIAFRTAFGVVALLGIGVFCLFTDYPVITQTLIVINGIGLLWYGTGVVLFAGFQGHELLKFTSAGAMAERIFISVTGVVALWLGGGTIIMSVIYILGNLLNAVVLGSFIRRITPSLPRVNWGSTISQIRDGVPYFLFAVFSIIFYRIDSVMLSKMSPETVVGWYGGAYRLFDVLNFLPYIFTLAVYPVLSRLWSEEEEAHRRTTRKSVEFIVLAGIPVMVGMIGFAPQVINDVMGWNGFGPSITVLRVLCTGILFLYVDMVLGTTLLSSDRQKHFSLISLAAIPVNVGLNWLLIPWFQSTEGNGGIGAAVATSATELFIMIAIITQMPQGILAGMNLAAIGKGFASGGIMAAAIWGMMELGLPWPLAVVASPLVYAGSILLLRTLEPTELELLRTQVVTRLVSKLRGTPVSPE